MIIKKFNSMKFIWRIVNDFFGCKRAKVKLDFPEKIGNFHFVKTIFKNRNINTSQFAVYKSADSKEYIAKQLSIKNSGLDGYWLRNEIATFSMFEKIFKEYGEKINERFPDIKVLKFDLFVDDNEKLLILTEKVSNNQPNLILEAWVEKIENVLNYFKYLNSLHDFKNEPMIKRNLIYMYFILTLSTFKALCKHPKSYREILKGFFVVWGNIYFLYKEKKKAFVHRDISYDNILIGQDGTDYLIDFALSVYAHPMWEVVHAMVNCRRKNGFIEAFSKTLTMQAILNDYKLRRLYKSLSIYCGLHLLSSSNNNNKDRIIANNKYLEYALNL